MSAPGALGASCAAALLMAAATPASISIGTGPSRVSLAVNGKGNALVRWSEGGSAQSVVIPPSGQLTHSSALPGHDASRPSRAAVPFALAIRQTADGRTWALQAFPQGAGKPPELHFARWAGAPTMLTLALDGVRLRGSATFQGKPVSGSTTTLEGKRQRVYVYLDCLGCPLGGKGWGRMIGVAPKADGSFAVALRPE